MKKIFSILAAVLFAGSMMAETSTLTFEKACGGSGTADDETVWTVTSDAAESNFDNTKGVHYGTGKVAVSYLTLSTSGIQGTITKVVVNASGASGQTPAVNVTVGGAAFGSEQTASATAADYTFEGSAEGEIVVSISQASAKKALYCKSVEVTYEAGPAPAVATPVISGDAEFTESTQVTITCATEGAAIYYTLDSSDPKLEGANVYTAPFNLLETTTVKAVAKVGSDFSVVTTKTFTKFEPLPDTLSCAQAREAALNGMTDEVTIRGYVTEIVEAWSSYKNVSFWMADTQDGSQVFEAFRVNCETEAEAPIVGDLVWVKGNLTAFTKNGVTIAETTKGGSFGILEAVERPVVEPAVNLGKKTIEEFLALKNVKDTCILTGVVDSIKNDQYGNLYLSDATAQVYVYGVLTADGQSMKFAELGVEAGDELTILALYSEYNNKPQVKNAIFVSVTKKDPTAISNTAVEGKAVKALVNGQVLIIKNGKTYNVLGARVR